MGSIKVPAAPRRDPISASGAAGSASIPEQWLNLHGDALFRYALLLGADEHRAEDLVQETLLAALEARWRYSADATERTWLIAILRHKVIDLLAPGSPARPVSCRRGSCGRREFQSPGKMEEAAQRLDAQSAVAA